MFLPLGTPTTRRRFKGHRYVRMRPARQHRRLFSAKRETPHLQHQTASEVSELRRVRRHGGVLAWLLAWLKDVRDEGLQVSAVTIGEIQSGIEVTREQDRTKAAEIEA